MRTHRAAALLLLWMTACTDKQDVGDSWRVVRPVRLFAESGFAKGTLYRRTPNMEKVDDLVLLWRSYGPCLAYVTAHGGNATYVVCGDRAPALVGLHCDFQPAGVVCADDASMIGRRRELRPDAFLKLTSDRPALANGSWRARDSAQTNLEMLTRAERLSLPP